MPRLLIVDDDPDLLTLLDAHYSVRGHTVDIASSCEEALRLAAARRPDAVILDFCMPKMDGARFIEILHGDEQTKRTPVIVMSAASATWVAARLPADPLVRSIEKPFEFEPLDQLLETMLGPRS